MLLPHCEKFAKVSCIVNFYGILRSELTFEKILNLAVSEVGAADIGWRRLIGCLKLQVIFHKRATTYRALLRKMSSQDKVSYGSSPSCMVHC